MYTGLQTPLSFQDEHATGSEYMGLQTPLSFQDEHEPTFLPSPYIRGNFKSSSSMVLYALEEDKHHFKIGLHSINDPLL